MSQQSTVADKAKALILAQGGLIRTREAISLGIHPRTIYSLRDSGELEELSRDDHPSSTQRISCA